MNFCIFEICVITKLVAHFPFIFTVNGIIYKGKKKSNTGLFFYSIEYAVFSFFMLKITVCNNITFFSKLMKTLDYLGFFRHFPDGGCWHKLPYNSIFSIKTDNLTFEKLRTHFRIFLLKYLLKQEWDITGEYRHVLYLNKKFELLKEFAKSVLDILAPCQLGVSFLHLAGNKAVVTVDRPQGRYTHFEPKGFEINKVKFC